MKITDLLKIVSVDVDVSVKSKDEAIDRLVDLMNKQGIYACEELSTTGIGEEIAEC